MRSQRESRLMEEELKSGTGDKGSRRWDVKDELTLQTRQRKGRRQQLNRKTEQTIEREEKTRARLRGKPQTEELFDSTLRRVKARSKTFTADFLIPTSGFTVRRERCLLDESLCSESVTQSRSRKRRKTKERKKILLQSSSKTSHLAAAVNRNGSTRSKAFKHCVKIN